MSITTKVRKTGRLFRATTDLGKDMTIFRDAFGKLQPDALYEGYLLDAYAFGHPDLVEYKHGVWGIFRGYELEEFHADLRLVQN